MQAASPPFSSFSPITIPVEIPGKGMVPFTIQRPAAETVQATQAVAKKIFVEAFTTNYTKYHADENPGVSIEAWLKIKTGIGEWLGGTFDEEYQEYLEGKKGVIYLSDPQNNLVGWISHSPVDGKGDVYLSQCSLEADWRNKKVSTTVFSTVLNSVHLKAIFPEAQELKLIVRKINLVARKLYEKAQFICDETIKPEQYGASYDNRYVGYRKRIGDRG